MLQNLLTTEKAEELYSELLMGLYFSRAHPTQIEKVGRQVCVYFDACTTAGQDVDDAIVEALERTLEDCKEGRLP